MPKRSASATGKLSRNKGKTFERQVAADLREIYGARVKRGWQAREGTDAPDVENVPYWVECKHHKKVQIQAAMRQARGDIEASKSSLPPLVVAKDNGAQPIAVLLWADFLVLLKKVEAAQGTTAVTAVSSDAVFYPAQPA